MEAYIFLALAIVLSCTSVRGQNECPAIQESELGSTTTPGTSGLIADAFTLGDPGSAPDILVLDSQTVCLAVGPTRDRYRYASVVVSFNCSGSLAPGNALGISTCDGELTVQFDFECVSGPQWQRALFLGGDNVFNPSDGSLTTSLRTDCSFCVDPAEAGSLGLTADMATHCADCDASCTGLMSCTSVLASACCNYYESDTCTTMCTSPLVPDTSNNCAVDCGSLTNPSNGVVTVTTTTFGSTANYSCTMGYGLDGTTSRTCQADGMWSGNEPACTIDPPTITVQPLNLTNIIPGSGVTITIAATGQFLSYSWQLNGDPLIADARHSGADSAALSIIAVRESDEGGYRCNVSNAAGSVVSNSAYLTVLDPSTIVDPNQPEDQLEATPGDTITFTVVAAGDFLMYIWQRNMVNLFDMGKFSGTNTPTLTITDVQEEEEGTYRCVVSNVIRNVTSRVAQLTVFIHAGIQIPQMAYNAKVIPGGGAEGYCSSEQIQTDREEILADVQALVDYYLGLPQETAD